MAEISSPLLKRPLPCQSSGKLKTGLFCHPYAASSLLTAAATTITTTADSLSLCCYWECETRTAKLGLTEFARELFTEMPEKNLESWNFVLSGEVILLFKDMQRSDMKPDDCALVNVLSACAGVGACSHGRLLNEGGEMFHAMVSDYEIQPAIEHYGCMVDLLGRFGFLKEAEELVREIPVEDVPAIWESLLSACRNHNHVELAKSIATKLLESNPQEVRRKMRIRGD
nr:pentatricopeptide repeat-containing protein At4g18840 [Ipomoea batatas]